MSPDDPRLEILDLLNTYLQRYPGEADMVNWYTRFVAENKNCFERSLLIGHVTGSALVLNSSRDSVLLTHHRKLDKWLQPGGHADGDADVLRVALKEADEETGLASIEPVTSALLDVDIHLIPPRGDEPEHHHYDCRFLLCSTGPDNFTVSEESYDLAWVAVDRIEDYTTEASILRMIEKARDLIEQVTGDPSVT